MQIQITVSDLKELESFLEALKSINTTPVGSLTPAQAPAPMPEPIPAPALTPAPEPAPWESAPTPAPAPLPVQKAVSRQDVQNKAIALMDAGKQAVLQELLKKYGVQALPFIPDEALEAFMADLEVV